MTDEKEEESDEQVFSEENEKIIGMSDERHEHKKPCCKEKEEFVKKDKDECCKPLSVSISSDEKEATLDFGDSPCCGKGTCGGACNVGAVCECKK